MTARLLHWPHGLYLSKMQPLSGPRTVGATSNESITGYVQTVASAFGLWKWQFVVPFSRGKQLRQLRGLITALHGGANAVRFTFHDPDRGWSESGLANGTRRIAWSNGQGWTNGRSWRVSPPLVTVAQDAVAGSDTITLTNEHWTPDLIVGDWIGFSPYHFGMYCVTEVVDTNDFRVWPPLAKDIATGSFATLRPTMVMRLIGEDGASWSRDPQGATDTTLTLVQVEDADVRDYFADPVKEFEITIPAGGDVLLGSGNYLLLHDDASKLIKGH